MKTCYIHTCITDVANTREIVIAAGCGECWKNGEKWETREKRLTTTTATMEAEIEVECSFIQQI